MFKRTDKADKFWCQNLVGKQVYVAEEMILTDIIGDELKDLLAGGKYFTAEKKFQSMEFLDRKPIIITSNYPIWIMCPRHADALLTRLFMFNTINIIPDEHAINFIYGLTDSDQYDLSHELFD